VKLPLSGTVQTLPAHVPPALTVMDIVASAVRAEVRVRWTAAHRRAAATTRPAPRNREM
jgi:hypothetical protein